MMKSSISLLFLIVCLCEICWVSVIASSKNKKHSHSGVLEPYDGKPLPIRLTPVQLKKLDNGEAVVYNERNGRSGRGVVVQDINASTTICMQKIRDLQNYPKVVPHLKKVEIYETKKFSNGTTKTGAKFDVGVLGLKVGYFLMCTYEPKYSTFTWTLDYKYNSDFDDNVGHWQVIPHPTKRGWTRVLYSTKLKLFPWIPEFIIKFLTGKALTESTGWVKRESELEAARGEGKSDSAAWPWLGFKGGECILDGMEQAKRAVREAEQSFHQRRQKFVTSWKAPTARFGFFKS